MRKQNSPIQGWAPKDSIAPPVQIANGQPPESLGNWRASMVFTVVHFQETADKAEIREANDFLQRMGLYCRAEEMGLGMTLLDSMSETMEPGTFLPQVLDEMEEWYRENPKPQATAEELKEATERLNGMTLRWYLEAVLGG